MNKTDNDTWQKLLALSAPTFAGEATPPYGFVTSTLTRLRAQENQMAACERIGWRALLASLAALAVAVTLTVTLDMRDSSGDFEPGVRSLVQMQNISVS
jgi:hypothetical protein